MTNPVKPDGTTPSTIKLHSGVYYDILNPENHEFDIDDIAQGLSHVCRFNGQCNEFYSVAQHSVIVAGIVARHLLTSVHEYTAKEVKVYLLQALLHDATESVIGDVTRPLKALLPQYKEIEHRTEQAIFKQFGLPDHMPWFIKHADNVALKTEQRDLMLCSDDWYYGGDVEVLPEKIFPVTPKEAKKMFLDKFYFLTRSKET